LQIKADISLEEKQLQANVLSFFIENAFNEGIGRKLRYTGCRFRELEGGKWESEAVCEITVDQGTYANWQIVS